ncbi:MAG TPA: hypothetical protein VK558_00795, partial [Patescibacteria group bacterium]|nr:hypothetical protein [Patescibacteria group bacterium]
HWREGRLCRPIARPLREDRHILLFLFQSRVEALENTDALAGQGGVEYFLWRGKTQGHQLLGGMDDRMLRDIGVHRVKAEEEARKPFWHQ